MKKYILITSILFLALASFAFAQDCPTNTTVTGTTVNFVGELTEMGGDSTTNVWFEYGETTSYGKTTSQRTLTQPEIYCISVSGLLSDTTYNYRAVAQNSAGISYGQNMSFTTSNPDIDYPEVNITANNSNGPITVDYDSRVTLRWTSSDVDYCYASNDWSGDKNSSGSQTTGNLTASSYRYTINCYGPEGSTSDSVRVYVRDQEDVSDFNIYKVVRNTSDGTDYFKAVNARPGDVLTFYVRVRAGNSSLSNVVVRETLPSGIIYIGDIKVDNVAKSGNVINGLNIGDIPAGEEKIVTFRGDVAGPDNFSFGQTELNNTVLVSSSNQESLSDTAKVIVSKTAVAGAATTVSTGFTNNVLLDSFFIPLVITLLILWFFKFHILRIEGWLDNRKKEYKDFKFRKAFETKVNRIRSKEL